MSVAAVLAEAPWPLIALMGAVAAGLRFLRGRSPSLPFGRARAAGSGIHVFAFAMLFLVAWPAGAGTIFCSDFPVVDGVHVIDGSMFPTVAAEPSSIGIDANCTFQNFPPSKPLVSTLNFQNDNSITPPPSYLVIFNNVYYTGNMACASVDHKIWFANSSNYGSTNSCQELFIPVETLNKENPGSSFAAIGVPFEYTITIPYMSDVGGPSVNTLSNVTVTDDLTATGASLTYLGNTAYLDRFGTRTELGSLTNRGDSKHLLFTYAADPVLGVIPAGSQIVIKVRVVLDNVPANTPNLQFTNRADWWFGRVIDGVAYDPLPGNGGTTLPMTIGAPRLTVTKTGTNSLGTPTLNLGQVGEFTIDVQNTGNTDAWNATIVDQLPFGTTGVPAGSTGGMCDFPPRVTAVALAGTTLAAGTDYQVSFTGRSGTPACQLSITLLSAAARIPPGEHLTISYESKLDGDTQNGISLTNVAAASQWFNDGVANTARQTFACAPTPYTGTVGVADCQDAHSLSVLLAGYWFEKVAANVTTSVDPTKLAGPGNTLHYTVYLKTSTAAFSNVSFHDQLPAGFVPGSLVLDPLPAGAVNMSNPATGLVHVTGLSVPAYGTVAVGFSVTLAPDLAAGAVISNQAALRDSSGNSLLLSDDPNDAEGISDPAQPLQNPTRVTIQVPQAPLKAIVPAKNRATIGETVVYQITVPGAPYADTLNGVVVHDLLDAGLVFVSASSGGVPLNNTGTGNQIALPVGSIASGQQVTVTVTARVANLPAVKAGYAFTNAASFSYTGGTTGQGTATPAITVVEPKLAATKSVRYASPAGKAGSAPAAVGDILEYVVTVPNSGGSTAFDAGIIDALPPELSLVANSATAVINGVAVGGFAATPASLGGGILAWGNRNGDGTLDIPVGQSLVLTYRASVVAVNATSISNRVHVDWSSLNGTSTGERSGSGCPTTVSPDVYCFGPAAATVSALDPTALAKGMVSDSWNSGLSIGTDGIVRAGDIVVYRLTLTLREGATENVVVTDTLPGGLVFDRVVSVNGDLSAPFDAVAPFTYGSFTGPTVSGNTVTWSLGRIENAVDSNPANNTFVLEYRAKVSNSVLATPVLRTLTNTASLAYAINGVAAAPKSASRAIELRQPRLTVSKSATTASGDTVLSADEIVTYTVNLQNTGAAPAYNAVLRDLIPVGMRNGAASLTMVSVGLVTAGTALPVLTPAFDRTTGEALWNFDTATAGQYAVPPGETLRVVYQVQVEPTIGAGVVLNNQAQVLHYFSFDSKSIPSGAVLAERKDYGATNIASFQLTTASATAPSKQSLVSTVAVGQPFTYTITVPATPQSTALYDVRILDNLGAAVTGVDMSLVSVQRLSGSQPWTPVNTGTATDLVIEDTARGIDIPAGEQVVIGLTVVLRDTANNTVGKQFQNTASYTYDSVNNNKATAATGGTAGSAAVTIIGPALTLQKSGPATMRRGVPGFFVLDVQNSGTGAAWKTTVTDVLPNVTSPAQGGMCGAAPSGVTARIYQANGTTPVSSPLVNGTDFTVGFEAAPTCRLTIAMISSAATLAPGNRLIITYSASLDPNTASNITLTNVAGATRYLSADPTAAGAAGNVHTYVHALSDGTPGTLDYQDAFSVTTESPVLQFSKTVFDVTTGQSGAQARPGDTLRYTLTIRNVSSLAASDFSLSDELDRLNATARFVPGTLRLVSVPSGATTTLTSATGGSKGTGLVRIGNLDIDAQGGPNDVVVVAFEARLIPVMQNGTVVLNQAQIGSATLPVQWSDDPVIGGSKDPTRTVIASSPALQVEKTLQDVTSGTGTVMAGDTLRYTITVKNVGTENGVGVTLQDAIPANTRYVANSTRLNGLAVADSSAGVSALEGGMLIHSAADTTPGAMTADAGATETNVATITFDVMISRNVVNGTVISNQAFAVGSGAGSGAFPEQPSDDPATPAAGDPTSTVVGNLPLVHALKTVRVAVDGNGNGLADPTDILEYAIVLTNSSATPATGVVLTDAVPAGTTYVANSVTMNGAPVARPDGGISPLAGGIGVVSSGLPLPSPATAGGTLAAHGTATVKFRVRIDAATAPGTVISNQGSVATTQLPAGLTDADGDASNGLQPTDIRVGDAQQLVITKSVLVVGGGTALPGSVLQYTIKATNVGLVPATGVVITDDLTPIAPLSSWVADSATMNGSATGVSFNAPLLAADYGSHYGALAPGSSVVVRFEVKLNGGLPAGMTVTNTAQVAWDSPAQTASASAAVAVGAVPGSTGLAGHVWTDANFNKLPDGTEFNQAGWAVDIYRNGRLLGSVHTGTDGTWQVNGLTPTSPGNLYDIRFRAPGAGATTAGLGWTVSAYTNGMQSISAISAVTGAVARGLNLPLTPNGVVYDSVTRAPIAGAVLTMVDAAGMQPLPASCFDDPAQQNQVTLGSGYYKFDINFSQPACFAGGEYLIEVNVPGDGMNAGVSRIIPPVTGPGTSAFSVPACPGTAADAVLSTADRCEVQGSATAPGVATRARSVETNYYLKLLLDGADAGTRQIFNNHIPVDPKLDTALAIVKTAAMVNVSRSQIVPYTITVKNTLAAPLEGMRVIDSFPAGFKYVDGSARLDGQKVEPRKNGLQLSWSLAQVAVGEEHTIKLLLMVGSGVAEGDYVNRAQVVESLSGEVASGVATATVRVVPDATFDCTDLIGKVFDDANLNGIQESGEKGLGGVRIVDATGLVMTTDQYGRFHLTCAATPDESRGSNFILKLDDRTLPTGFRVTTDNPLVERITRGKMRKFNFGATVHRVVRVDTADGVFEEDSAEMRPQWAARVGVVVNELRKGPSILRIAYSADVEPAGLVGERINRVKEEILRQWNEVSAGRPLTIETELFWRRGGPVDRPGIE